MLLRDLNRTILSIMAVAAALVLVLVLEGFQAGLWHQVRAYREQWPVQLVEVPQGVSTLTFTRIGVPAEAQAQTAALPGVQAVYPLVGAPMIFVVGEQRSPITLIGYEGVGGPAHLRSGRQVMAPGEVVLDYALAKDYGLKIGNEAPLFGREFHIVGLSNHTSSMLGSYVFIHLQDAYTSLAASAGGARPNLLLVQTVPGQSVPLMRSAIAQRVLGVAILTPDELADHDVTTAKSVMGSLMQVLVMAAYISGVLIIGATLYAAVVERTRDYGVMKALGTSNRRLYAFVGALALVFTAAGFVVAVGMTVGLASLLAWLMPKYLIVTWNPTVLFRAGLAGLAMALVGAVLPIRQIRNVDPAMVFR